MREPFGKFPPFGSDTHTVGRQKKGKREGAGKRYGKTTFLSTDQRVKETWTTFSNRNYRLRSFGARVNALVLDKS